MSIESPPRSPKTARREGAAVGAGDGETDERAEAFAEEEDGAIVDYIGNEDRAANLQQVRILIEKEVQTPLFFNNVLVVEGKSQIDCLKGCPAAIIDSLLVTKEGPKITFDCHYVSANEKCTGIITHGKIIKTKSSASQAKPPTKELSTNIRSQIGEPFHINYIKI